MNKQTFGRGVVALVLVILGMIAATMTVFADNPTILPPNSKPFGKTYGEWSVEHWKWIYSLPVDHHPLFDTADCSAGQSGKVWFLGGMFSVTNPSPGVFIGNTTRNCKVPVGKALFFPIVDVEGSTVEGNGVTEAELRAFANFVADHAANLFAEIDGKPITNLNAYRAQSPLFTFGPLPANNALGLPQGTTSPAVSDGYFLMIAPLSSGRHTIHFKGSIILGQPTDPGYFEFSLDITYNITVK
ncbi:MAG: hypothetical protein HZC40_15750 [Chloroflexi bacterium]|nr:hypothetical protein [Chloroflexota bacterium]